MTDTYILKLKFKDYEPNTQIKLHSLEAGIVTISIVGLPQKYMLPVSYIRRVKSSSPSPTIVTQGAKSFVPPADWSKLDAIPITYADTVTTPSIKVHCYCGLSYLYYRTDDMRTQHNETAAINKAIASCPICSERHLP